MKRICFGAFLTLALTATAWAQSLPAGSVWQNQRGSEMTVTESDTAGFKGTFVNNADGFECKGAPMPMSGKALSKGLFFTVTFAPCATISVWHGKLNGDNLPTRWQLEYVNPKDGSFATMRGRDYFKRIR